MSFANENEHRAALAKLFATRPQVYGPPAPCSSNSQPSSTANASAILQRLRQKSPPPAFEPLRIINSTHQSLGFGRWRFANSWRVEFNREPLIAERTRMEEWAANNCERGFSLTGAQALLYNKTDWTLFLTTFK